MVACQQSNRWLLPTVAADSYLAQLASQLAARTGSSEHPGNVGADTNTKIILDLEEPWLAA